jgi:hypothetical protein
MVASPSEREAANVSLHTFFHGSTAPFGGSSRQPGQFRSQVTFVHHCQLQPILPLPVISYTVNPRNASQIFIPWGDRAQAIKAFVP